SAGRGFESPCTHHHFNGLRDKSALSSDNFRACLPTIVPVLALSGAKFRTCRLTPASVFPWGGMNSDARIFNPAQTKINCMWPSALLTDQAGPPDYRVNI